ncbi:hypothetical protein B0O80DRAFT_285167 [Mortierella sp. GBAus27b]|nr:hypothetical protein B0O80DRAFT_285167 [Mortierella sp. GBAus27b]
MKGTKGSFLVLVPLCFTSHEVLKSGCCRKMNDEYKKQWNRGIDEQLGWLHGHCTWCGSGLIDNKASGVSNNTRPSRWRHLRPVGISSSLGLNHWVSGRAYFNVIFRVRGITLVS